MEIYVQIDGTTKGPFSIEQVRQMLLIRQVTLTHQAFIDGRTSWMPLSQVPGLQSDSGVQTASKNSIGGLIAAVVIVLSVMFCCFFGQESSEERQEEMQPVRDEMNRKMRESKTREEAAREIVDEEVRRQELKKQMEQNK